ncbi:SDR family oxidoreductase [Sphingomonas sp. CJ99]
MADARRSIFITGGASGIGLATGRYFAERGWRIGLADVNEAALGAALTTFPANVATAHAMDVRDPDQWRAALAEFTAPSDGRLNVLFNNAGIPVGGPFHETPLADLHRLIDVNFTGVVNGAHAGFRHLARTPGSCLLNTASAAGIYGTAGTAVYSGTKFAVRGLTEALDGEWHRAGIKVRSLMPSFIETPLLDQHPAGSNRNIREAVLSAGLELTPVEAVAEAAWRAVHGDAVHTVVGKTAERMRFAARWMPGKLRKQARGSL